MPMEITVKKMPYPAKKKKGAPMEDSENPFGGEETPEEEKDEASSDSMDDLFGESAPSDEEMDHGEEGDHEEITLAEATPEQLREALRRKEMEARSSEAMK